MGRGVAEEATGPHLEEQAEVAGGDGCGEAGPREVGVVQIARRGGEHVVIEVREVGLNAAVGGGADTGLRTLKRAEFPTVVGLGQRVLVLHAADGDHVLGLSLVGLEGMIPESVPLGMQDQDVVGEQHVIQFRGFRGVGDREFGSGPAIGLEHGLVRGRKQLGGVSVAIDGLVLDREIGEDRLGAGEHAARGGVARAVAEDHAVDGGAVLADRSDQPVQQRRVGLEVGVREVDGIAAFEHFGADALTGVARDRLKPVGAADLASDVHRGGRLGPAVDEDDLIHAADGQQLCGGQVGLEEEAVGCAGMNRAAEGFDALGDGVFLARAALSDHHVVALRAGKGAALRRTHGVHRATPRQLPTGPAAPPQGPLAPARRARYTPAARAGKNRSGRGRILARK